MGAIRLGNWVMNLFLLKDRPPPKIAGVFNAREILDSVISVIKNPLMKPYIIAYSLRSTNFVFGIWMTQFLIDVKGFTYLQSGQITSIGTLAAIPGCIVVAAISDRMMNRKKPLLFFGYSTFIAMAVFMFLPASMPMWVSAGVNAVIYVAVGYWVLFFSMVPEILRSEETGIGLGVINAVCTLGISLLSPVYGALVDSTGSYFTSNMLMLVGAFHVPLLMTNVDESYGGIKKKLAAPRSFVDPMHYP